MLALLGLKERVEAGLPAIAQETQENLSNNRNGRLQPGGG